MATKRFGTKRLGFSYFRNRSSRPVRRDGFGTRRPELHEYYANRLSLQASANQSNDCDCASGHCSNLDKDDCKWTATGTKEKKHIGSKD